MQPLDLRVQPPRPPRDELEGLLFLPRSIDKVRALLPGGNLGSYVIEGLTQALLDTLGISLDAFTLAVSAADDDREIAAFVREHANPAMYEQWNEELRIRQPRNGNRAEALTIYPWLKDRPEMTLVLDVLGEDDKQSFSLAQ